VIDLFSRTGSYHCDEGASHGYSKRRNSGPVLAVLQDKLREGAAAAKRPSVVFELKFTPDRKKRSGISSGRLTGATTGRTSWNS
jgi:hypothetical protein